MRSAIFASPREIRIEEVPLPEPVRGEVRVRLEGCGICASNVPVWEGRPWFEYPLEPGKPGHEGWGVVDMIGDDVEDFAPGDRVALLSYNAYAEYDLAPVSNIVKLPSSLDGKEFPGEPLGCTINIFRRSGIRHGDTVAIIGVGYLGAMLTELASKSGARVIAITRRPYALEIARQLGAHETIPMDDHWAIIEHVKESTSGAFCDCVIEAVGKQWPLDLASELVKERGRLIVAGYHQDGLRQVNMQLWNWRGIDVINAHERDPAVYIEGIRGAVEAVDNDMLHPSLVHTHKFTLDQIPDAFEIMQTRPEGFMKALVIM